MIKYITAIFAVIIVAEFIYFSIKLKIKERKNENTNSEKIADKESMETGNGRSDFDASLDVLRKHTKN